MNKHEFYKELMKEYTFDSAKVRRFAKRSSLKGAPRLSMRRWWHIPSTVAVAAASLVVGVFAFFYYNDSQPTVADDPEMVCAFERIRQANDAAGLAQLSFGTKTLFLSFNDSMTLREVQNTLDSVSDTGNIVIETVYVVDNDNVFTAYTIPDELDALKNNTNAKIVGAKVSAPAALMEDLSRQQEVALIEIETDDLNDDTFVPLAVIENASEFASPVAASFEPFTSETDFETGSEDSHAPLEKFVNLNVPGVIEAGFISDYRFTAITADSVKLYQISECEDSADLQAQLITRFELRNHRTRLSATGNSMLISGSSPANTRGDDSARTQLLLADAATQTLEAVNIEHLTDSGELLFAFYDDINARIILRVRSDDRNIIYIIEKDNPDVVQTAFDSAEDDAAVLAINTNSLYYSVNNTAVYRYDIETQLSARVQSLVFDEPVSFERNVDLSAFVILSGGTAQVFTARTEMLSNPVEVLSTLAFYKNSTDLLVDGISFYALSREVENSLEIYFGQPESPVRIVSDLFLVFEITADSVRILLRN
jgi:sulfur transfer complex TusBCD TusB component (DsrH family)